MTGVSTLGEAMKAGWRVRVRCALGKQVGLKRIRECMFQAELHMLTLVATRGRDFPIADLAGRLRCPWCGARQVSVAFVVPGEPKRSLASG